MGLVAKMQMDIDVRPVGTLSLWFGLVWFDEEKEKKKKYIDGIYISKVTPRSRAPRPLFFRLI